MWTYIRKAKVSRHNNQYDGGSFFIKSNAFLIPYRKWHNASYHMIHIKGSTLKFTSKKVILFDLDGTLIDSAPDLASAINHMLSSLARPTFSEDTIRSWVGNGANILVKRGLSGQADIDNNLDEDLFAQALHTFLSFYKENVCINTRLYLGVHASLTKLKAQGYRLVIVTNKPVEFIQPILVKLALSDLFEMQLGGDSLAKRKPSPEPLLHVCQALNVSVEECLMVGDSKNDILAAKAANMDSIGLTYGYNYGEDIALHQPELVCDNFSDIVASLTQL